MPERFGLLILLGLVFVVPMAPGSSVLPARANGAYAEPSVFWPSRNSFSDAGAAGLLPRLRPAGHRR